MAGNPTIRLNKVLRELNISLDRAVDHLASKGHDVEARPTTKITDEVYQVLLDEFQTDKSKKVASKEVAEEKQKEKEELRLRLEREQEERRLAREKRQAASDQVIKAKAELSGPKTVGKIDLDKKPKVEEKVVEVEKPVEEVKEEPVAKKSVKEETKKEVAEPQKEVEAKKEPVAKEAEAAEENKEPEVIETQYKKLTGPKIAGDKIDLSKFQKPKKKKEEPKKADAAADRKKRRRQIVSNNGSQGGGNRQRGTGPAARGRGGQRANSAPKVEPTEEEVQKQVRETLEKLQGKSKKGKGAKYRRDKRDQHRQQTLLRLRK
jgi:translation initiation factor IF-2